MGLFDKAKQLAEEHADKLDSVVDRAAEVADERTGGAHTERIGSAADRAKDFLADRAGGDQGQEPPSRLQP